MIQNNKQILEILHGKRIVALFRGDLLEHQVEVHEQLRRRLHQILQILHGGMVYERIRVVSRAFTRNLLSFLSFFVVLLSSMFPRMKFPSPPINQVVLIVRRPLTNTIITWFDGRDDRRDVAVAAAGLRAHRPPR